MAANAVTPEGKGRSSVAPIVRCVEVSKYFGGVCALNRVSVDLRAGEVVCLVGDNGAGKSTLVNTITGIHQPDEGELWVGDEKVDQFSPLAARDHGIETVHQHLALADNLSASANVVLGNEPFRFRLGPLRFVDEAKARDIAVTHIRRVGIELSDPGAPVRRLSGGQRQAIAIARALANDPRLIMFDEPTAALGVAQTSKTLELVRRVAGHGVACLVISHNLDDVFAVADRVVAMRLGRVVLDVPLAATTRKEVVSCMTGM